MNGFVCTPVPLECPECGCPPCECHVLCPSCGEWDGGHDNGGIIPCDACQEVRHDDFGPDWDSVAKEQRENTINGAS